MINFERAGVMVAIFIAVFLTQAVLLLGAGHLAITGHEVDVFHASEAAIRLSEGQAQHIDFMSPLGVLTFAPVAAFLAAGFGISTSFLSANLLVALLMLPLIAWVSLSRFKGILGACFGVVVLLMVTAVVFGGDQATVSMSMYYNRWAWGIVFLILSLLLIEPTVERPTLEGAIIGVLLGILALLKMTFFISIAPIVFVALLTARDWHRLLVCGIGGVVVALIATLFLGFGHWAAYLADMRFVSASDVRPQPGIDITSILSAPAFLPASVCLLACIIGLRKTGHERFGLILLLLVPAFTYITFQNWGNDQKWLILLGFLAIVWRRSSKGTVFGTDAATFYAMISVASFAIIGPSMINMSMSTIRNFFADDAKYIQIADDPRHTGLKIERERSFDASGTVPVFGVTDPQNTEESETLKIGEFEIPRCELNLGYFGVISAITTSLQDAGYRDAVLAFADVTNPLAIVGGFQRTEYGSPWYYGGARSAEVADFVVVPKCPISHHTFSVYIKALNELDGDWDLVEDFEHAWVFIQS